MCTNPNNKTPKHAIDIAHLLLPWACPRAAPFPSCFDALIKRRRVREPSSPALCSVAEVSPAISSCSNPKAKEERSEEPSAALFSMAYRFPDPP